MSENHGPRLSYHHSLNAALQESFNKCKTYLAMVAFILQDSPGKMLTFSQLMDRLEAFGSMRTRSFENNIRVCLSANTCFVKIALSPSDPWNNWRLDHSKITEKMVRRHLKGVIWWFPEFTSMERKDMLTTPPPEHYTTLRSPEAAACKAVNSRCEVKFSSSFSIDSILKKDRPSGLGCKASPLVKVQRKLNFDRIYADDGFTDCAAARPTKRMCMSPDPSNATRQERFNECKTYLAMIAFVLQDSPENMLTFSQLMNRLDSLGSRRTKSFENTVRVRLSTDTCFVKISFSPESPCNYWKLDHSKITEKMVHRHFHGLLEWFPEFTSIERKEMTPPAATSKAVNSRCEVKFSSSFSIDSILKKDSPSGRCCKASPLSEESEGSGVEQEPSWSTERTVGLKMKFTWDSSPVDSYSVRELSHWW